MGWDEWASWFVANGHFEAFVLVGISLGYAFHLGHVLEPKLGRHWLPIVLSGILAMFVGFMNLPKLFM